ncbi:MAG: sigma-54 dependent transcriptional regulator [Ruminobacter sp.]|nr:sigma-54 dependent transcriptional regulator [Ruminobacter sp.]
MAKSIILVVDDDQSLREAITDTLLISGYQCKEASDGIEALSILSRTHVDMVISDIQMAGMDGHTLLKSIKEKYPNIAVLLMTAYANIDGAVKAMRDGAIDYLAKPFAPEVLLNQVSRYAPIEISDNNDPIFGDPQTASLLTLAKKVAQSDATVMITGPSGSGKEVLSRFVHNHSNRKDGPFVALNCAAIPETMLEATLFGYEKGAFTGAVQSCPGKFEQAQNGTILLDEITEMELSLQAKLLRVLQEKEVERIGSRKTISLDVRVIATSNRDLKVAVSEGKFREDLYYRLNVFPLKWLPLAKRKLDILPIAEYIISKLSKESKVTIKTFSDSAKKKLLAYDWPGNVRELDNVMQRAMIIAGDIITDSDLILDESCSFGETPLPKDEIKVETLKPNDDSFKSLLDDNELVSGDDLLLDNKVDEFNNRITENNLADNENESANSLGGKLKHQEYRIILDALIECGGSRQQVAEKLGISGRTLRYKIAKMKEAGYIIPS